MNELEGRSVRTEVVDRAGLTCTPPSLLCPGAPILKSPGVFRLAGDGWGIKDPVRKPPPPPPPLSHLPPTQNFTDGSKDG